MTKQRFKELFAKVEWVILRITLILLLLIGVLRVLKEGLISLW